MGVLFFLVVDYAGVAVEFRLRTLTVPYREIHLPWRIRCVAAPEKDRARMGGQSEGRCCTASISPGKGRSLVESRKRNGIWCARGSDKGAAGCMLQVIVLVYSARRKDMPTHLDGAKSGYSEIIVLTRNITPDIIHSCRSIIYI